MAADQLILIPLEYKGQYYDALHVKNGNVNLSKARQGGIAPDQPSS